MWRNKANPVTALRNQLQKTIVFEMAYLVVVTWLRDGMRRFATNLAIIAKRRANSTPMRGNVAKKQQIRGTLAAMFPGKAHLPKT